MMLKLLYFPVNLSYCAINDRMHHSSIQCTYASYMRFGKCAFTHADAATQSMITWPPFFKGLYILLELIAGRFQQCTDAAHMLIQRLSARTVNLYWSCTVKDTEGTNRQPVDFLKNWRKYSRQLSVVQGRASVIEHLKLNEWVTWLVSSVICMCTTNSAMSYTASQ